eukprot:TRINITY_DN10077_c0_g1_i2.p1 TRINITY_DN10077_c0_g1~~TRINITY_DN10077_c0_g1_i2.p1  ORF type:complete len:368 (-),score=77.18 TRINITY_DN10077_c0_g1_i2:79-1182(-)
MASADFSYSGGPHRLQVVLLHRHGSRGPSRGALKPFQGAIVSNGPTAASEWRDDEVEQLTPLGLQQMNALGRWFDTEYFGKMQPGFLDKRAHGELRWRSSRIDRVVQSGQSFWQGFAGASPPEPNTDMPDDHDPDAYFRVYDCHVGYLAMIKELKGGTAFEAKGRQELATLDALYRKAGLDPDEYTPQEKLSNQTYFKEMLDCELYAAERTALLSALSQEDREKVEEYALWVWTQRFFQRSWAAVLGGNLLSELVSGFGKALGGSGPRFIVYSVHDYTILSLLAALGFPEYPGGVLGYGSFLLLELYSDGRVDVRLNSHPFEAADAGRPRPTLDVQFKPNPHVSLNLHVSALEAMLASITTVGTPSS